MITHALQPYDNWMIAYSPYVDTLHAYQKIISTKPKNELVNKENGRFFVVYDLKTMEPLLFEVKQASRDFDDIDNMRKEDILERVSSLVK